MTSSSLPMNGDCGARDSTSLAPQNRTETLRISSDSKLTVSALSLPSTDSAPIARDDRGRFLKGNPGPRTHGLFGRISHVLIEQRQQFELACIADDGGDVPTRRAARLRMRARVHVQLEALGNALEEHGLFDKRGRLRVAWLQRFDSLVASAVRIDASLGSDERRARDVSKLSAVEYAKLQEASGTTQGADHAEG